MAATYTVEVERGKDWFLIRVPEIRGAVSQARRLRDVEPTARDLVALMLEVPPDSFELAIGDVRVPWPAAEHLERAQQLREAAARYQAEAAQESRAAASTLKDDGWSLRDIGQALGVSFQRAHQLVTEKGSEGQSPTSTCSQSPSR